MIKNAIAKLVAHETLSREEAAAATSDIMSGKASEAQIGAIYHGAPTNRGKHPKSLPDAQTSCAPI